MLSYVVAKRRRPSVQVCNGLKVDGLCLPAGGRQEVLGIVNSELELVSLFVVAVAATARSRIRAPVDANVNGLAVRFGYRRVTRSKF